MYIFAFFSVQKCPSKTKQMIFRKFEHKMYINDGKTRKERKKSLLAYLLLIYFST